MASAMGIQQGTGELEAEAKSWMEELLGTCLPGDLVDELKVQGVWRRRQFDRLFDEAVSTWVDMPC